VRLILKIAIAAALLAAGGARAAEPAAQYTPDDFVKAILKGPQPCPKGASQAACEANPKTRRFTLATPALPDLSTSARPAAQHARPASKPVSVSAANVMVTFALNSAEITDQGQANLRAIAEGLSKPALAEVAFEVAGFTDVTGSAAANLDLSQRRAEAVKAFLVAQKVWPGRLKTAGYGQEHLLDPTDPTSEANRRVELHRLN
jgi:outer membrane protein OmpA-like peptidoglycan-associated protein